LQAMSGLMALQGGDGPPQYLRIALTDYYTASLAAQGVLAALFVRERTGRGQRVETSLLQGVVALQSGLVVDYPGRKPVPRDNPTYRLYCAGDGGWFFLACGNQSFWLKLCELLGRPDLAQDPRFGSWMDRIEHHDLLHPILTVAFATKPRDEWLRLLAARDIPAARVQTLAEFMRDPAVAHHRLVVTYEHPEVGELTLMGLPISFSETPGRDAGPPPTLGQHTGEILTELGYPDTAIADLTARGIVGPKRRETQ
ncbi:MAG: CoA transferase, partial [Candidatus Rokubacteria bacterium]|nr:CoA transferase [Candidatus Rokubacteria bacterium]